MGLIFWKGTEYNSFRAREDGNWDFFPHGPLSGGYRVNPAQRERIASGLRHFYGVITAFLLVGTAILLVGVNVGAFRDGFLQIWHVIAALIGVLILHWFIALRPLWRGLPRAERRLGFGEVHTHVARTLPKWRIIYTLVFGQLFALLSLPILWRGNETGDTHRLVVGAIGVIVGIAITWVGIVTWRKRRSFERSGA
jgi:O-antigen/teichoic acid export membrane protein